MTSHIPQDPLEQIIEEFILPHLELEDARDTFDGKPTYVSDKDEIIERFKKAISENYIPKSEYQDAMISQLESLKHTPVYPNRLTLSEIVDNKELDKRLKDLRDTFNIGEKKVTPKKIDPTAEKNFQDYKKKVL